MTNGHKTNSQCKIIPNASRANCGRRRAERTNELTIMSKARILNVLPLLSVCIEINENTRGVGETQRDFSRLLPFSSLENKYMLTIEIHVRLPVGRMQIGRRQRCGHYGRLLKAAPSHFVRARNGECQKLDLRIAFATIVSLKTRIWVILWRPGRVSCSPCARGSKLRAYRATLTLPKPVGMARGSNPCFLLSPSLFPYSSQHPNDVARAVSRLLSPGGPIYVLTRPDIRSYIVACFLLLVLTGCEALDLTRR